MGTENRTTNWAPNRTLFHFGRIPLVLHGHAQTMQGSTFHRALAAGFDPAKRIVETESPGAVTVSPT